VSKRKKMIREAAGALGEMVRAQNLPLAHRSAPADKAEKIRWPLPKATHEGVLRVGEFEIDCAVLEDGTRVISQGAFERALGRARAGGQTYGRQRVDSSSQLDKLPIYLAARNLKNLIPKGLSTSTIRYIRMKGGSPAIGVEATMIPRVCEIWLAARRAGLLRSQQLPTAERAELLLSGLAIIGVIAVVDEATGYQKDRVRNELQKILEAYVLPEMQPWLKRFPDEFFKEIYRIMGWDFREGSVRRPGFVGTVINEWVYKRLPSPVLPKLCELNPVIDGRRRHRHHQHLTQTTGIPHLDKQISVVTALMRASTNRRMFEELMRRSFPVLGDQMSIPAVVENYAMQP
jgi:P63C domain